MSVAKFCNKFQLIEGTQRYEIDKLLFIYNKEFPNITRSKFLKNTDLPYNDHFFFLDKKSVDNLDALHYLYIQEFYKQRANCLNRYIKFYNLQPGEIPTKIDLLYELYLRYGSTHSDVQALSEEEFTDMICAVFPSLPARTVLVLLNENINVAVKLENAKTFEAEEDKVPCP